MTAPPAPTAATAHGQLQRLKACDRPTVHFTLNGHSAQALQGDTVLTAVLTQARHVRINEFSQQPRAGFCVMGACQDCWVRLGDGRSVRACQSLIEPGMCVYTHPLAVDATP